MEFNNKLTQDEIEKLNINKEINQLEETDNINNFQKPIEPEDNNENVRFFEVLTDGCHFWVSVKDMGKICTQISVSQLETIGVKLDTDVVFGETYVNVNDEFLIYVQKNTKNPKYIPQLGLLMTKNRDYDYSSNDYEKPKITLNQAYRVDGGVEIIEEIEGKTR